MAYRFIIMFRFLFISLSEGFFFILTGFNSRNKWSPKNLLMSRVLGVGQFCSHQSFPHLLPFCHWKTVSANCIQWLIQSLKAVRNKDYMRKDRCRAQLMPQTLLCQRFWSCPYNAISSGQTLKSSYRNELTALTCPFMLMGTHKGLPEAKQAGVGERERTDLPSQDLIAPGSCNERGEAILPPCCYFPQATL